MRVTKPEVPVPFRIFKVVIKKTVVVRGKLPYGLSEFAECNAEPWGHIDLLEDHFGENWVEEMQKTYHWQRLADGHQMSGNTGSVDWAICTEYRRWHDK